MSIDMKTNVVQYEKSEIVTFELRHENKSCRMSRETERVLQDIPGSQLLSDMFFKYTFEHFSSVPLHFKYQF